MNAKNLHADTLIHAPWIVPVEPRGVVLHDHCLAILNGKIAAIFPEAEAASWTAKEDIFLKNHVLTAGFVNLHGHSAMTLLRGKADDLPLMEWLEQHIWPAEGKFMRDDFVFEGSKIGMAEMIRSGTTTVNDMYFFHSAVARAGIECGMRTVVGCTIIDFPTAYAQTPDEHLQKALDERAQFLGEPLIDFTLAPHAPYTVSDDTFRKTLQAAEQYNLSIHCHIQETQGEVDRALAENGLRPLARLEKLGVLSSRLIAAHMVACNEDDIALAAKSGLSVAHNPASNMKLASGIAPIAAFLSAGINVGLGTDGAASNNTLDMLAEMRMAALLAKVGTLDPTAVPAAVALEMATLNGAKALHMQDKIGSLVAGKDADIIAIDLHAVETQPVFDVISHLVYAAAREQVSDVWIAGERLLKSRQLTRQNHAELLACAQTWRQKIANI